MKKIISASSVFLLGLVILVFTGCTQKNQPFSSEAFVMSTYVTQQVYGANKEKAAENVNELLVKFEEQLSLFKEASDIGKINKNAGHSPVQVNDYTFDIIKTAKRYSELSQKRFDITIAPITLLWGIDTENARVPEQAEISKALELVSYENIKLDEQEKSVLLLKEGMALDLGGIAKGYIIDEIKSEYEKQGITSALVSIGGNVFAYGTKPDGTSFKLGIRDPNGQTSNALMGTLTVKDKTVATTGAYERNFEKNGKLYHHILDINTGYPVESDLAGVTVISADGGLADYLSTTLYIAGKENIKSYINDDRFEVIVIDKQNKVYISPSLKNSFKITNDAYTFG